MSEKLLFVLVSAAFSLNLACGSAAEPPANGNRNTNTFVNVDPNNLPPGLSASPIVPSANSTPGIPANATAVPKGATPTPGIPDPATLNKPMKPGATPTPGIPDPATLKRQMQGIGVNEKAPPPANGDTNMSMKSMKGGRRPMSANSNVNKP